MKYISLILIIFTMASCNMNSGSSENTGDQDSTKPSDYPEHGFSMTPIEKKKDSTFDNRKGADKRKETQQKSIVRQEDESVRMTVEEQDAIRQARQYFSEGLTSVKKKKYAEGIESFNKVIELKPDNSKAYYNRGFAFYHLKSYNEAEADFRTAISLNSQDSTSYLYLGLIEYFRGDFERSISALNKTLELAPGYSTAYYNRGLAKGQLKQLDESIRDFDRAIEINPNYHEALYNRGLAKFFTGDTTQACTDWFSAKELGSAKASEAVLYYCQ